MENVNPVPAIINRWNKAAIQTKIAVLIMVCLFLAFFIWRRVLFYIFIGSTIDAGILSVICSLLLSGKIRRNCFNRIKGNAIYAYFLLAGILFSGYLHGVYCRLNTFYPYYFLMLIEFITISSNSSRAENYPDNYRQLASPSNKTSSIPGLIIKSGFSGQASVLLCVALMFIIWGSYDNHIYGTIKWNSPTTLSIQGISRIEKRLPFSYHYEMYGYLGNGQKATIGWNFDSDNPEKFKKGDLIDVYPIVKSKWRFIAKKLVPHKPWHIWGQIPVNGSIIAGCIIFLLWIGIVVLAVYHPVVNIRLPKKHIRNSKD